jgi:catalase (peroxidase I)
LFFHKRVAWTNTPILFANTYYKFLTEKTWIPRDWKGPLQYRDAHDKDVFVMMLPTDIALLEDTVYRPWVYTYAQNEQLWKSDFGLAFSKLLHLGME